MPTVFRSGPYRFFFYAGDRDEPHHIHVERDDKVAKFPGCVWDKPWVIHCKPAVFGIFNLLEYLGRSVRRVAITEKRIIKDDGNYE